MPLADGFAIAAAATLPLSVTAASIAIVLWLLAVLPILDWSGVRRVVSSPAGGLPALLFLLAIIGMAWSAASPADQFGNIKVFARLLIIVALVVQFQRSERGLWVLVAFLSSCALLLIASWLLWLFPSWGPSGKPPGVPVKDYIVQSGEFLICAFALAHLSLDAWRGARRLAALALGLLALLFLANIGYVAFARSTLLAAVVLALLFVVQRLGWRQAVLVLALAAVAGALTWMSSSQLRGRMLDVIQEVQDYRAEGVRTSSGYRLEFWTRAIASISQAPFFGHGTGSQREQFRRTAVGEGISAAVTDNPHNQTLVVAMQFGALGTTLLYAMWFAHILLFRGDGWVAWIGTALIVQNIVAGLFNTPLVEFTHSWMYIFGVGVLGGMMLRAGRSDRASSRSISETAASIRSASLQKRYCS